MAADGHGFGFTTKGAENHEGKSGERPFLPEIAKIFAGSAILLSLLGRNIPFCVERLGAFFDICIVRSVVNVEKSVDTLQFFV